MVMTHAILPLFLPLALYALDFYFLSSYYQFNLYIEIESRRNNM